MNKAFEKILERLEEKKKFYDFFYKKGRSKTDDIVKKATDAFYDEFVKIVQEVEDEYNGGWVPCSDRLPEEPKENPLFEYKALEVYLVTTKYGSSEQDKKYPFRAFWNGINFTDGMNILDVIAWQPLPEVFKESD